MILHWLHRIVIALAAVLPAWAADPSPAEPPPGTPAWPRQLVAIAFLGPCAHYATVVAPLLKQHDFGATFYVDDFSEKPPGTALDESDWMNWPQLGKLSAQGFEIGSAAQGPGDLVYDSKARIFQRVEGLERRFADQGLPKPTTFIYPGGWTCGAALQILADQGYAFAVDYHFGLLYEPAHDHPLLVPSRWFYGAPDEPEMFRNILETHAADQIPVLLFDDTQMPARTSNEQYRAYVKYLADHHYTVIAVRDLARYVNAGEAMRAVRFWRRDGGEQLRAALAAQPRPAPPTAMSPLQRQLESLILPQVNWREASLDSVLKALRQQIATSSGGKIQAGFALDARLDLATPVTLRLVNVPAMEALRYLGDLSQTDFFVDQYAISAKPKTTISARVTVKTPVTAEQISQLESLIIPEVNFNQTSLSSILGLLSRKVGVASGGKLAPDFVIMPGMDAAVPATLHLTNTPFMEILRYLGDLTRADFAMDRYAISVSARINRGPRITPKTPAEDQQIQTLQSLVIPSVECKDATLGSALEFLARKAAQASGGKVQPCFVVMPEVDAAAPVTLSLAGVPFTEALRYCTDLAGVEYVAEKYAITVKRKEAAARENAPVPFALVK